MREKKRWKIGCWFAVKTPLGMLKFDLSSDCFVNIRARAVTRKIALCAFFWSRDLGVLTVFLCKTTHNFIQIDHNDTITSQSSNFRSNRSSWWCWRVRVRVGVWMPCSCVCVRVSVCVCGWAGRRSSRSAAACCFLLLFVASLLRSLCCRKSFVKLAKLSFATVVTAQIRADRAKWFRPNEAIAINQIETANVLLCAR